MHRKSGKGKKKREKKRGKEGVKWREKAIKEIDREIDR